MQLITQQYTLQVSGGKAVAISKRAEDVATDLTKINNHAIKMHAQLERLEENFVLVQNKLRKKA